MARLKIGQIEIQKIQEHHSRNNSVNSVSIIEP